MFKNIPILSFMTGNDAVDEKKELDKPHEEYQYLHLVERIISKGTKKNDRTGVGTLSVFAPQLRFTLHDNVMPLITTKKVFWKGVVKELLWFIKGSTNSIELQNEGVNIWAANSSRAFLDGAGFTDREVGDLGPIYGFQWRHFGAEYKDMHADYTNQGIDQLQDVINKLKTNPDDRRIIMSAWNPMDIPKMALPPCHCFVQFYVSDGELSCHVYQRSADMGLGVPFNIASYSLLTYMIAHVTKLKPGELVLTMGDCHVYSNHIEALRTQMARIPKPFPTVEFKREVQNIDDFKDSDIILNNYEAYPKVDMSMAV